MLTHVKRDWCYTTKGKTHATKYKFMKQSKPNEIVNWIFTARRVEISACDAWMLQASVTWDPDVLNDHLQRQSRQTGESLCRQQGSSQHKHMSSEWQVKQMSSRPSFLTALLHEAPAASDCEVWISSDLRDNNMDQFYRQSSSVLLSQKGGWTVWCTMDHDPHISRWSTYLERANLTNPEPSLVSGSSSFFFLSVENRCSFLNTVMWMSWGTHRWLKCDWLQERLWLETKDTADIRLAANPTFITVLCMNPVNEQLMDGKSWKTEQRCCWKSHLHRMLSIFTFTQLTQCLINVLSYLWIF